LEKLLSRGDYRRKDTPEILINDQNLGLEHAG
jgi:hypothetical protein